MKLAGVSLKMFSSHHPQTDGSTEIMNKMVENYLRYFVNYHQNDWDEHLISAKVAYNSAFLEDHRHSPYFLDLGWEPKQPLDFFFLRTDTTNVSSVEELVTVLKETLSDFRAAYRAARARQTSYAAQKHKKSNYKIDKMLLKKTLFQDCYTRTRPSAKLSSKKFGPFEVLEIVGKNAIKLNVPPRYHIYPVVRVIHTEAYFEQPNDLANFKAKPSFDPAIYLRHPDHEEEVEKILKYRKRGRGFQFLVKWRNLPDHETLWEPRLNLQDADGAINEQLQRHLHSNGLL